MKYSKLTAAQQRALRNAVEFYANTAEGGAQDREEFAAWVRQSPDHIRAYLITWVMDRELPTVLARVSQRRSDWALSPPLRIGSKVLRSIARSARQHWSERLRGTTVRVDGGALLGKVAPRLQGAHLAIAAGIVLVALAIGLSPHWLRQSYATALGESRLVTLKDGSSVLLNTQSQLRVWPFDHAREVELVQGEAIFDVAVDSKRPFRVRHGNTVFQALGTRFDVRVDPDRLILTVVSGRVGVMRRGGKSGLEASPAGESQGTKRFGPFTVVSAGAEAIQIMGEREALVQVGTLPFEEIKRRLAWREHRIMLSGQTIGEALAEFHRYDQRQVIVLDPAIEHRQISGTFLTNRLDVFVASLAPLNIRVAASYQNVIVLGSSTKDVNR